MKLYELAEKMRKASNNNPGRILVKWAIVSNGLQKEYGSFYNGKPTLYGGGSGNLSDIPVFLGGHEVLLYEYDTDEDGNDTWLLDKRYDICL